MSEMAEGSAVYTPTTEEVKDAASVDGATGIDGEAFDRWLTKHVVAAVTDFAARERPVFKIETTQMQQNLIESAVKTAVAAKDAEIETLRSALRTGFESKLPHEPRKIAKERDAALAQLRAIAALADEAAPKWVTDDATGERFRSVSVIDTDRLNAILADSTAAIAKWEQGVRADEREKIRRAIKSAGNRHAVAAREDHGPLIGVSVRSAWDSAAIVAMTPDESPDSPAADVADQGAGGAL